MGKTGIFERDKAGFPDIDVSSINVQVCPRAVVASYYWTSKMTTNTKNQFKR